MPDFSHYNHETKQSRADHKARVAEIMSGVRGVDGLTDGERQLLATCRQLGIEISGAYIHTPHGDYWHERTVRKVVRHG